MSQFKAFCAAAVKAKTLDQAAFISSVAVGAQGDSKSIKAVIGKLGKAAK